MGPTEPAGWYEFGLNAAAPFPDALAMGRTLHTTIALLVAACCLLVACTSAGAATRPSRPYAYLDVASDSAATVRWMAVRGATRYEVRQNGVRIAMVKARGVVINGLRPATYHQVQVLARNAAGASVPSDPVPVVTRAPAACTHYVSTRGSDAGNGSAKYR